MDEALRRGSDRYRVADPLISLAAAALSLSLRFLREEGYGYRRLRCGKDKSVQRGPWYGGEDVERDAAERRIWRHRRSTSYLFLRDNRHFEVGAQGGSMHAGAMCDRRWGDNRSPVSRVLGLPSVFCYFGYSRGLRFGGDSACYLSDDFDALKRDIDFRFGFDYRITFDGGLGRLKEKGRAYFGRFISTGLERLLDFDRTLWYEGVSDFMFGTIGVLRAGFEWASLCERLAAFRAGFLLMAKS